jgi:hypothetical protein
MSDNSNGQPPTWYYLVAVAALIWNAMGVMAYVMQVMATPEALAEAYTPEQVALLMAVPAWATSATAIATHFGLLGCVILLLRKSAATWIFVISLVAIVVQDIYLFVLSDSIAQFGTSPIFMQTAVLLIAMALVWYSRLVANRYYR